MDRQSMLAVKAGVVIIAGLVLIIGLSLRTTGHGWFARNHQYEITADFNTAKGLEAGSQVVLSGVPIGRVQMVDIVPNTEQARVFMLIHEPYRIPSDSVATIQLKTMLGNYQLYMRPGKASTQLKDGDAINAEEVVDIQQALQNLGDQFGKIGGGSNDVFASIQENQDKLFKQLTEVVDENRGNLKTTTDAFAEAAPKFKDMIDNLDQTISKFNQGEGTLGKLANDDKLYAKLTEIVGNLEKFSTDLNAGQGTLSRLIHDKELGDKIDRTFENVNAATGKLREIIDRNEKNIDQTLESVNSALPKLDKGLDSFVSIGEKIDKGEGTLGKLINDPELYNNVRDAVNQIRRTFEEGEEQSVMRTFLGLFVGSVI